MVIEVIKKFVILANNFNLFACDALSQFFITKDTAYDKELMRLQKENTDANKEVNERGKSQPKDRGIMGILEDQVMRAVNARVGFGPNVDEKTHKMLEDISTSLRAIRQSNNKMAKEI